MDFTALGLQIKRLRQTKRLTMKELGARVGLSYQQIDNIESARRRVPLARLEAIAGALGHRLVTDLVPADAVTRPVYLTEDASARLAALDALDDDARALVDRMVALLPGADDRDREFIASDLETIERQQRKRAAAETSGRTTG